MGRVVVEVMPKPEILDPQGKAISSGLDRLGLTGFTDVRQGKRFELTVDGAVTADVLAQVKEAASTLLSNPVIEDVVAVTEVPDAPTPSHPRTPVGAASDSVAEANDDAGAGAR
ncbi:phosphoribosylformylglycinamidine synthase subunit PurS [Brevibacterium ihuae]|uniref:phosphoribosylformylglycinamidine synthase subunit PurS n=1 Tax=Brevibacterium ihuae TaxID=1631743 RepID=UPI000C755E24|nr:phosphoribosylformylglycinamidine synthase subunit PurS [Brevibacterium ihuae]